MNIYRTVTDEKRLAAADTALGLHASGIVGMTEIRPVVYHFL